MIDNESASKFRDEVKHWQPNFEEVRQISYSQSGSMLMEQYSLSVKFDQLDHSSYFAETLSPLQNLKSVAEFFSYL